MQTTKYTNKQIWHIAYPILISLLMEQMIRDAPVDVHEAILHHAEGVDLIPSNIELSGMEVMLVNAMSREFTLKSCLSEMLQKFIHIAFLCSFTVFIGIYARSRRHVQAVPSFDEIIVMHLYKHTFLCTF